MNRPYISCNLVVWWIECICGRALALQVCFGVRLLSDNPSCCSQRCVTFNKKVSTEMDGSKFCWSCTDRPVWISCALSWCPPRSYCSVWSPAAGFLTPDPSADLQALYVPEEERENMWDEHDVFYSYVNLELDQAASL